MTDTTGAAETTAKPIPPGSTPGAAAAPADDGAPRERNADGTFKSADGAAEGAAPDKPALARDLDFVGLELDDKDYPKETLPGMPDERKDARSPRVQKRQTMRERIAEERTAAPVDGPAAKLADTPPAEGAAPAPPVDPSAPPPAAKYRFKAGKDAKGEPLYEEFDSEDKFHDNVRTLRGMYRAGEAKRTNAEEMSRRNYQAAVDWKAKAEAYERGELTPPARAANGNADGRAAADASATPTAPEDDVVRKIDWKGEYRQVKADARAMVARGEIAQEDAETLVHAWVARETAKQIHASVRSTYDPRFEAIDAPNRQQGELVEHGRAIIAKMGELATVTDSVGVPLYPEFDGSDPEARQELGAVIGSRATDGIPWDHLKTHKGIHESILLWRDWRRMQGRTWTPPAGSNGNGTALAPIAPPQAGVADAMRDIESRNAGVVAGRSAPPRPAGGSTPASRFRQGVMDAGGNKLANVPWPE